MVGAILSWFGRIWIAIVVVGLLNVCCALPLGLADDWLFNSGWVPAVATPIPAATLWWIVTVVLALPGIGAVILGDNLRKRRAARASRLEEYWC